MDKLLPNLAKIKRRILSDSSFPDRKRVCEELDELDEFDAELKNMDQNNSSSPKLSPSAFIYDDGDEALCKLANKVAGLIIPDLKTEILESRNIIIKLLTSKIEKLEEEIKLRDDIILDIKDQLDENEQYLRREAVRINGIEELDGESTDNLVVEVGKQIGVDLDIKDINRSHRVGDPSDCKKKNKIRPIIVRFKGYYHKKAFMRQRKELKNIKESAPPYLRKSKLYINDDLTKKRSVLDAKARQLYKEKKIDGNWTIDGIIFVKLKSGKVQLIKTERDFDLLLKSLSLKMTISTGNSGQTLVKIV